MRYIQTNTQRVSQERCQVCRLSLDSTHRRGFFAQATVQAAERSLVVKQDTSSTGLWHKMTFVMHPIFQLTLSWLTGPIPSGCIKPILSLGRGAVYNMVLFHSVEPSWHPKPDRQLPRAITWAESNHRGNGNIHP